jgi:hypothetical protein
MTETGHVHPRRPTQLATCTAVLLSATLALGACAPDAPAPPAPGGSPSGPSGASAPGSPADRVQVEVSAGDVTLELTMPAAPTDDPQVHVSPDPDASTATVTVDTAALDESAADVAGPPALALTSAGTLEPRPDGSVTVRDDHGPVGGLSAPRGARLVAVDATHLELRATSATAGRGEVATTLGTVAVAGADWGEREGGRSLAVAPTDWARDAGQAGVDLVRAELVAADPEVDTPTMRDQLECHAIGAPDKDTWNLEPWRPDVGLVATMAARCNPTS